MNFDTVRRVVKELPGSPRVRVFEEDFWKTQRLCVHFNCHRHHVSRLRAALEPFRPVGITFVIKAMGHKKLKKANMGIKIACYTGVNPYAE